jgi:signal peptidase II
MRLKGKLYVLVLVLIAIDQLSKWSAEANLPFQQPVDVVPFFSLYLTYNTGVAFSMLSWFGSYGLIALTAIVTIILIVLWQRVPRHHQLTLLGFAFVIAGAIGNLIDRVSYGHVIDFFLFHTQSWAFAVFNVADAFITIGAAAIIIDELFSSRTRRAQDETQQQN